MVKIVTVGWNVFFSSQNFQKPWCLEPLHIAWHNLIHSNASLYDQILQYIPIDIQDIRSLLKSIDLRYETNVSVSVILKEIDDSQYHNHHSLKQQAKKTYF